MLNPKMKLAKLAGTPQLENVVKSTKTEGVCYIFPKKYITPVNHLPTRDLLLIPTGLFLYEI